MSVDADLATLRDKVEWLKHKFTPADSDTITEMIDAYEAEIARLRDGLRWYADDANYRLSLQDAARGRNAPVVDDDGHRARALLAEDGAA